MGGGGVMESTMNELRTLRSADQRIVELTDEVVSFHVEGRAGRIGRAAYVSYDRSCLVVTMSRILRRRRVIPAAFVHRIDKRLRKIFVSLTKEDVEKSPNYDDHLGVDEDCERDVLAYYARLLTARDDGG